MAMDTELLAIQHVRRALKGMSVSKQMRILDYVRSSALNDYVEGPQPGRVLNDAQQYAADKNAANATEARQYSGTEPMGVHTSGNLARPVEQPLVGVGDDRRSW